MVDLDTLQTLVPINSMDPANYEELAAAMAVEEVPPDEVLFKHGATDNETVYLLRGEVELIPPESPKGRIIAAGTDQARYPLAQLKPRQFTGKTKTAASIARVASDLLDRLLTWDQVTGEYEVTELAGAEDAEWTMQVLRNKAFQMLPATNINELFTRLEPVPVEAGQVIIQQGEIGDYFYIIKEGHCNVSRKSETSGKVTVLSELSPGESFGEEALLSETPRNASIIMMATGGILMRLSKGDFDELLKQPIVRWVAANEAKAMLKSGAGLLDVRTEDEYKQGGLKHSINVPLYLLRLKVPSLNRERSYIIYCETGNRSCAAAFLLSEYGFDVCVLKGGLAALRDARKASASGAT
ncbi:MAG: cyclic nucleotide-binding domain-containing protein [Acidiferrobacterales bacterium]